MCWSKNKKNEMHEINAGYVVIHAEAAPFATTNGRCGDVVLVFS
jgi:hypothetical protein